MKLGEFVDVNMGQSPIGDSLNEIDGIEFHQGKIFFGELDLDVSPIKTTTPAKCAKPGDVLICVRAPVGVVNITDRVICIGRGLAALTPKDGMPERFLLHLLRYHKKVFEGIATGSTFASITTEQLKNIDLPLPPFPVQRRIAGVLGAIDEKIAVNRRKIAELEALAKTVYDYWFVQFDFPDAHGRPYRSSGGKMTWNAALKRDVPEGWEVVPLSELATITMGQSPSGASFNEVGEGMPFFQGSTDFGTVAPENRVFTTAPSRMAQAGDLLLSVRAPVGATNLALTSCCIGRGLASLRGRNCSTAFIRRVLENASRFFAAKNVDGTTFGSLSKDELRNIMVLKPSDECLRAFDELAEVAEKQLLHLSQEIRELTSQREALLPLLMNGQVEVAG